MMKTFAILALVLATLLSASALKHKFTSNHDSRYFIGPIGEPFGFLGNGFYRLQVFDYRLDISKAGSYSKRKHATEEENAEAMEYLHPGFVLKRFDSQADYDRFHDDILNNPIMCSFGDLIPDLGFPEDNSDENVAHGKGVVDAGGDGIFLSMKDSHEMWRPNTPLLEHSFTVEEAGYYFLSYQVCIEGANYEKYTFKEIRSTFHLVFDQKNIDRMGNVSFLTAGEMPLPHLFLYFSISYGLMLVLWVKFLHTDDLSYGAKPTVYAIHHLMSAVLFLKTLSIFFESVRLHFIRINGHAELWSFVYYVFTFLKGISLFTVVLLIGSGWSFFKPVLSVKERRIIFFVFFLQVIDNIAVVVLTQETMGEHLYNDWSAILHLVDIISCCAILIPIVWQVNSLEQSIETTDLAEASMLRKKLNLFRSFYLILVTYIYFTRIVVYIISSTLPYNHTWLRYLIAEFGTILFYLVTGLKFRPKVEEQYSPVSKDEENELEMGEISNDMD